ncbi:ribonuclease Z [Porphyromonas crevioricanis]|uniref:Ribonuclease Z n=1 Tax=Porphyromonas crevioricanis TaxID=393921 RepID=A0AB34PEP1_9PORP|nr:ribonuclease Z [Porphyromonas crevioricanis]KGN93975.1 ribonuclease Z [Porphyromonas crevioricanis]
MATMELLILGCGSAAPTTKHLPSCQILEHRGKLYMIDCGEGAQLSLRKHRVSFSRLVHIFISHLHGDHCFGLPGIISSMGLLGRTAPLFIHGPSGIELYLEPILKFFCDRLPYEVKICPHDTKQMACILETRSLEVHTLPLNHRIPCAGFLFREKIQKSHLIAEMAEFYKIPVSLRKDIIAGADYTCPDGTLIPNSRLTKPANTPKSYAYCSDTAYHPQLIEQIKGISLLYHEATFMESECKRAIETCHSTAKEAARIAQLSEAERLLIGHYSARYTDESGLLQEARSVFPNTIAANEGMTIEI